MNGRILYEVVVTIAPEAREAYVDWLRPHMRRLLACDGFLGAELYCDVENPCVLTCSYGLRDRAAINAYLAGPAAEMRADGAARFGAKMTARRRILERLAP